MKVNKAIICDIDKVAQYSSLSILNEIAKQERTMSALFILLR